MNIISNDRNRSGLQIRSGSTGSYFSILLCLFLAAALTGFSPLEPRTAATLDVGVSGDLLKQVGYLCFFFAAIAPAIFTRPSLVIRSIPIAFLVFFAWCATTLLWSPVLDIAARRLILTFVITATLFTLSSLIEPRTTIKVTSNTLNALVVISLIACIFIPPLAIHQPGDTERGAVGDWRGIFYHKNLFGSVAAIATIFNYRKAMEERRKISWFFLLASLIAVWMSGSKTSLGVTAASIAVMSLWTIAHRGMYRQPWVSLTIATAPLSVAALAWWFNGPGLQLLSDPELLTGRGRIWQMMSQLILEHPLEGRGYQSVFQIGSGGILRQLTSNPFFQTLSHAHNAYIEIAVSTGLIGLALFFLAICTSIFSPLRYVPPKNGADVQVTIGVVTFALLQAFTESGLVDRDRPVWMMFVLAIGTLRASGDQRSGSGIRS